MEIPYIVNARKDTGLNNSKIAIWLFLASEVMLFGGLFSSYIFLRIFADYPWPERVLPVLPGLLNTFILIASSVTVVFAWASLKLRNWGAFKGYMGFTLACAGIFMVLKGFEYNSKFKHHNIQYNDWTNVEGHVHYDEDHNSDNYYRVKVEEINFDLTGYYGPYLDKITEQLEGKEVKVTKDIIINDFDDDKLIQVPIAAKDSVLSLEGDDEGSLRYVLAEAKESFINTRANNEKVRESALRQAWKNVRSNADGRFNAVADLTQYDQAKKDAANTEYGEILSSGEFGTIVPTSALVKVAVESTEIRIDPSWGRMSDPKEGEETSVSLLDQTVLLGTAGDSGMYMDVDAVDHRHLVMKGREREYSQEKIDAMIEQWYTDLGDSPGAERLRQYWAMHKKWRDNWEAYLLERHGRHDDGEAKKEPIDIELYRMHWKQMVAYKMIMDEGSEPSVENVKKHYPGMVAGFLGANHGKYNTLDGDDKVILKDSAFPELYVAREDMRFESSFSPKMNNYYAIYFVITGLHGLHVIGGALVLGYYLFFGRKMYEANPEWLANRVEVGGLFWHFVDLVWIFVFPIFYLM